MPKIQLPQKNLALPVADGDNLMQALLIGGVPVASSCLGEGICGKCRLQVIGRTNKPSALETETLKRNQAEISERLSCQLVVSDDLVVTSTYW